MPCSPSWSPHGQRIAYWGLQAGGSQRDLWTVAAAGGEPVRVTNDPAIDWSPAWSPDGRYLYFSSDRSGWLQPVASGDRRGQRPSRAGSRRPCRFRASGIGHLSVSASGTSIAMASMTRAAQRRGPGVRSGKRNRRRPTTRHDQLGPSTRRRRCRRMGSGSRFPSMQQNGQEDLWVVKRDGTGLRQVTNDAARDRLPSWSADGTRLMFQSSRDGGRFQVWTIATDGGAPMQVTDRPESLIFPIWNPDGTRALVATFPGAKLLMFDPRVPAAQQRVEELPVFAGGFAATSWSADGTRVAGFAISAAWVRHRDLQRGVADLRGSRCDGSRSRRGCPMAGGYST